MTRHAAPLSAFSGYGIELEYMIVDRDSCAVKPLADVLLHAAALGQAAPRAAQFAWSNELALHLLEVKNVRPQPHLDGLAAGFQAEVERIDRLLASSGARLMPGAMHPWMNPVTETRLWPHRDSDIYRAYDRIFDCRTHGWANIQSMQVNLAFGNDEEFARLHAAARVLLPILPALAASSPIADGRERAVLDFRMGCYRIHPARMPSLIGLVIPDNAYSLAEYEATVLARMYADIAPFDPEGLLRQDWLNAQGAIPRFERHALEIRVIDMQECPRADLAIAALTGAVARALYDERWSSVAAQRDIPTAELAAILLGCIGDADRAIVDNAAYLEVMGFPRARCEARELWQHLFDSCAADPLLLAADKAVIETILDQGPLARRILRAVGKNFDHPRLLGVYRELCDCLASGRLFERPGP